MCRNDSGWQEEAVDLTADRGQTIYVYINVFNDGKWLDLDVCR